MGCSQRACYNELPSRSHSYRVLSHFASWIGLVGLFDLYVDNVRVGILCTIEFSIFLS